ncbi:MAG TPA: hypothetical protein VFM34_05230 [Moraxellaceae bacterium]|nr:hypothetical protein [Moraxellaceae bacterium]
MSRLDEVVARYNTQEQARFQLESMGRDFGGLLEEDRHYKAVLDEAEATLRTLGRVQRLERGFLPNFLFGPDDVVVVVGQDGLVANTLKYLEGQPLVAINPDPGRIEGILLPFRPEELGGIVKATLAAKVKYQAVTMAEAVTSDGQRLLAVNDFFVGVKGHTSARYEIEWNERREYQSSSGIIVSTGLGSSGWMRSVLMGAEGICRAAGMHLPAASLLSHARWDARELYFYVREPFPGRAASVDIIFGRVESGRPLSLFSDMAEKGILFSDGMEDDFVAFSAGLEISIGVAERQGQLVI